MIPDRRRIRPIFPNAYKIFLQEYEEYKNLYNLRNRQNISEIRDVINKYGENAKIHLAKLDSICFFGCDEYTSLKKAIDGYGKNGTYRKYWIQKSFTCIITWRRILWWVMIGMGTAIMASMMKRNCIYNRMNSNKKTMKKFETMKKSGEFDLQKA